jgi:hypothetical protein
LFAKYAFVATFPLFVVSFPSFGRQWEKILVPGGVCADGNPYHIFVSPKNPAKVTFDFMGGGACWNTATCYGPTPLTLAHPLPFPIEFEGFESDNPAHSPASDQTIVYFPYCTGDNHAGAHTATYFPNMKVHHKGKLNFEASLKLISEKKIIDFDIVEKFTMYGSSAGALGALMHTATVEPLLKPETDKIVIADAPGLHFGPQFWDKFSATYRQDLLAAMKRIGINAKENETNIAKYLPQMCQNLSGWRIGFLQGSYDAVMSLLFGNITGPDHHKAVFGEQGLAAATREESDNCSSWIAKSPMHTFLVFLPSTQFKAMSKTARDFTQDVIDGTDSKNYWDEH